MNRIFIAHEDKTPEPDAITTLGLAETPFGPAVFAEENSRLRAIRFKTSIQQTQKQLGCRQCKQNDAQAQTWAEKCFRNQTDSVTVPLVLYGSDFRRKVWRAMLQIPPARTCSYGQLARRIGKPAAARAIGSAAAANPIAWIVPCHRVIGADGSLTGFASGITLKAAMLKAEQHSSFPGRNNPTFPNPTQQYRRLR